MKLILFIYLLTGYFFLEGTVLKNPSTPNYVLDKTIDIKGDDGYDYLSIDSINRRLYVSHGTKVDVIDLQTEKPVGMIEGLKGAHGIAIANDLGRGFISDGTANDVVAFELSTLKTIATIPVSGKDPDAICYDRFSKRVFAFNGHSENASVIDAGTMKETGTISLGGSPEFAVSDGAGKIYNNLEDKNQLAVIDTRSLAILDRFPLSPCGGPTGLYLEKQMGRLFTACRENKGLSVLDVKSGKVLTTMPIGTGVDAVAFDPAYQLIFCSNGDGTVTIIKQGQADSYEVVQTLATQVRAKTLVLDARTHKIYLSVADVEKGTRNRIPGTFKVLVYRPGT